MAARARKKSGAFDRSLSKSKQKAAAAAQTAIPKMRPIQLVASSFQRTAFRTQEAKPRVSRDHITRQNNSSALRRSGNVSFHPSRPNHKLRLLASPVQGMTPPFSPAIVAPLSLISFDTAASGAGGFCCVAGNCAEVDDAKRYFSLHLATVLLWFAVTHHKRMLYAGQQRLVAVTPRSDAKSPRRDF